MLCPRNLLQETFQALLDVMERNFAALKLPEAFHSVDDKTNSNIIYSKNSSHLRTTIAFRSCALAYVYQPILNENYFTVSRLAATTNGRQNLGVIKLIIPISRTLESIAWPNSLESSSTMENVQKLNESNEPMEIEEISYTEINNDPKVVIKQEKMDKVEILEVPENAIRDSYPKVILRESRLTGIWDVSSIAKIVDQDSTDKGLRDARVQKFSKKSKAYQKCKAKLRPLVKKEAEKSDTEKTSNYYFWRMLFFILFPIAVLVTSATIARNDSQGEGCAHRFNASNAIMELENRIFGQTRTIQELGAQLTLDSSGFKVLALIGGSGIGKSYSVHIISENFQPRRNLFYYAPPLDLSLGHATAGLSFCGCNLIVLENMGNRDIEAGADFVRELKNAADNYCVLVIEVINVQETDDSLRHAIDLVKSKLYIENIYREKNLDIQVLVFEPLDDASITKCIREAARSRKIELTENDIDSVKLSLRIADSGCKGAHAKVQLLDKKFED